MGALVDAQNLNGATPLHLATAKGDEAVCMLLMSANASEDIPDSKGQTAADISKQKEVAEKERKAAEEAEAEKRRLQRERRSKDMMSLEEQEALSIEARKQARQQKRAKMEKRAQLRAQRASTVVEAASSDSDVIL